MSTSMPPPRWQRLTLGLAPMMGLSVLTLSSTAVEIAASENTVLDFLLLAISVTALMPACIMAKAVLAAERQVTSEMQARYETLHALLTAEFRTDTPLVNPHAGVMILGIDEPTRTGREREFVRFAIDESPAARDGTEYRVYERFSLHAARPIVRHKVDAVSIQTDPSGDRRARLVPCPQRTQLARSQTRRMVKRTGLDLATIPDLDELIAQIRSGFATAAI